MEFEIPNPIMKKVPAPKFKEPPVEPFNKMEKNLPKKNFHGDTPSRSFNNTPILIPAMDFLGKTEV